jgi:hypothetical protein
MGKNSAKLRSVSLLLAGTVAVATGWTAWLGIDRMEDRVSARAAGWLTQWSGNGQWLVGSSDFQFFPKPRWVANESVWVDSNGQEGFRAREIRMVVHPWQWVTGGPAWELEIDQPRYSTAILPVAKNLALRWPLSVEGRLALKGGPDELQELDLKFSSVQHQMTALKMEGLVKGSYRNLEGDWSATGFVQLQGEVVLAGDELGFEAELKPQAVQIRWGDWLDIPAGTGARIALEGRVSQHELALDHVRLENGSSSFRGSLLVRRQEKVGPPTADSSQVVVQARLQSEVMKLADIAPWIPGLKNAGWTVTEGRGELLVQVDGDASLLSLRTEGAFDGLIAQSVAPGSAPLKGNGRWRWVGGRWEERQADLTWGTSRMTTALTEPVYGGLEEAVALAAAAVEMDPSKDEVRTLQAAPKRKK